MKHKNDESNTIENDIIQLTDALKKIIRHKKLIYIVSILFVFFGLIHSFVSPEVFTSRMSFTPNSKGQTSSSINNLSSIIGFNLGAATNGDLISPELYPEIINSVPFKRELFLSLIEIDGQLISFEEYLKNKSSKSSWRTGSNGQAWNKLNSTQHPKLKMDSSSTIFLSDSKMDLKLSILEENGIIELRFKDRDKYVAAQMVSNSYELLKRYLIKYKTDSSKKILEYTTERYNEKKVEFELLQDSVAIFKDKNLNISSLFFLNKLDRLERKLEISSAVLKQLATEVENAKLQVTNSTPLFMIIDPVIIPNYRSSPNRKLIVAIWTLLGFVLSTGFVLVKDPAKEIIASIRE